MPSSYRQICSTALKCSLLSPDTADCCLPGPGGASDRRRGVATRGAWMQQGQPPDAAGLRLSRTSLKHSHVTPDIHAGISLTPSLVPYLESAGRMKNSLLLRVGFSGDAAGDCSSPFGALVVSMASAVAEGRSSTMATTLVQGRAKSAWPAVSLNRNHRGVDKPRRHLGGQHGSCCCSKPLHDMPLAIMHGQSSARVSVLTADTIGHE